MKPGSSTPAPNDVCEECRKTYAEHINASIYDWCPDRSGVVFTPAAPEVAATTIDVQQPGVKDKLTFDPASGELVISKENSWGPLLKWMKEEAHKNTGFTEDFIRRMTEVVQEKFDRESGVAAPTGGSEAELSEEEINEIHRSAFKHFRFDGDIKDWIAGATLYAKRSKTLEGELADLKALAGKVSPAYSQLQFFQDGYRNGSASISEVMRAGDDFHKTLDELSAALGEKTATKEKN